MRSASRRVGTLPEDETQLGLFADPVADPPPGPRRATTGAGHPLSRLAIQAESTSELVERASILRRLATEAAAAADDAIFVANCAGQSWRSLGKQLGVPHQTLHRRHGGKGRGVE